MVTEEPGSSGAKTDTVIAMPPPSESKNDTQGAEESAADPPASSVAIALPPPATETTALNPSTDKKSYNSGRLNVFEAYVLRKLKAN